MQKYALIVGKHIKRIDHQNSAVKIVTFKAENKLCKLPAQHVVTYLRSRPGTKTQSTVRKHVLTQEQKESKDANEHVPIVKKNLKFYQQVMLATAITSAFCRDIMEKISNLKKMSV